MKSTDMPDRIHKPNPGTRIARICTECLTRKFGQPDWRCDCAGGRKTIVQTNVPYFGQSTA